MSQIIFASSEQNQIEMQVPVPLYLLHRSNAASSYGTIFAIAPLSDKNIVKSDREYHIAILRVRRVAPVSDQFDDILRLECDMQRTRLVGLRYVVYHEQQLPEGALPLSFGGSLRHGSQ